MAKKLVFGIAKDGQLAQYTHPVGLGASEVFSKQSGRWVKRDGSGYFDAVDGASDEEIVGAVEFVGTANSTDGVTKTAIQINPYVPYEMPVYNGGVAGAALTQANIDSIIGMTCGIIVASNIQYADLDNTTATQQVLRVVGGVPGAAGYAILHCVPNLTFKDAGTSGSALSEAADTV